MVNKTGRPVRALGLLDIFCIGLNTIIGSGIFLFPGALMALTGPSSSLVFAACGLLLATVALCYAELGSMFPGSGGSYLYAREAFGDRAGFGVGLLAWAAGVLSWAAVASILAGHLEFFHPAFGSTAARKSTAAGGLFLFAAINYRGIKPGAWTVNALTAAKVLPLLVFVAAGAAHVEPGRFAPFFSGEGRTGYAVFLALWALQGFEVVGVPAGESANPQADVPKAVLGSLLTASVFYTLIQAVAVGTHPGLAASAERPLADAAARFLGPPGATMMVLAGVVSMTGFTAGAALGVPRFLSALGERSLKPLGMDRIHPRFGTPGRAIAATAAAGAALALAFDFSKLIDMSNLAVVTQYLASCAALIALRRTRPGAARPYRVPMGSLVGTAGCAVSFWLMGQVGAVELKYAAALLTAGYAADFALRRGAEGAP